MPLPVNPINPANGEILGRFVMGDLNGDGRSDLAYIHSETGVIDVYFQTGQIGTSSFGWNSCLNKGIFGLTNTFLYLKDIDGDGW